MSFLEHLEELRSRIIRTLLGVAVAFGLSLIFTNELWRIVVQPARQALRPWDIRRPGPDHVRWKASILSGSSCPCLSQFSWLRPGFFTRFGLSFLRVCTGGNGAGPRRLF